MKVRTIKIIFDILMLLGWLVSGVIIFVKGEVGMLDFTLTWIGLMVLVLGQFILDMLQKVADDE